MSTTALFNIFQNLSPATFSVLEQELDSASISNAATDSEIREAANLVVSRVLPSVSSSTEAEVIKTLPDAVISMIRD